MTVDYQNAFRLAISEAGLRPPDQIVPDGQIHRFSSNGKLSDNAGYYLLHTDGIPAGCFGDWRTGQKRSWRASLDRPYTSAEEAEHRRFLEAAQAARDAESAHRKATAKLRAGAILARSIPANQHPYLEKKKVWVDGLKTIGRTLVVPMMADGELQSLQFIGANGAKKFLTGGRTTGCYFPIGNLSGAEAICIAEGIATSGTIHLATGLPVVAAFSANNLLPVAHAIRAGNPTSRLILCADNDISAGNPGLTKSREAAMAVGGALVVPDFGRNRATDQSDFNDLAAALGPEAVRATVLSAIGCDHASRAGLSELGVTGVTSVQAPRHAGLAVTPSIEAGVTGVTDGPIPKSDARPTFVAMDGAVNAAGKRYRPGVWYFGLKSGRGEPEAALTEQWVCSPLHVEAVTFDSQQNNFGRLLRFQTTFDRWRIWAMPMEMLRSSGDEMRGELLSMGVQIDPNGHRLLNQYLQFGIPNRQVRCAQSVGWCGDNYVLPDEVFGPSPDKVIFQSGERGHEEHTRSGTLDGWQQGIAAVAIGNPLLMVAISASFAGPMLNRCNVEGGGIHFVGDSSTGKTTAIEAACATWGGPTFRRSWRATANGMEGAATMFNDCLLALDEISECDPREVGAIVYALGNGRGKQRASRSGSARSVTQWRTFILSSGERTIETTMSVAGQQIKAGQSVRLLDIPASRKFGAWDQLHEFPNGTALSDRLKTVAKTHYGHAGRAFLKKLTEDSRDFAERLEAIKKLRMFATEGEEGQDRRAAARFALLALSGELATEYGITGWPAGAAIESAVECFRAWRSTRGRGNDERRTILEQVAGFIERHGDSRFSDADAGAELATGVKVINRAGWWRDGPTGRVYLFHASGMRDALVGQDFKRGLAVLEAAGALIKYPGKRSRPERVDGRPNPIRLYSIQLTSLREGDGA